VGAGSPKLRSGTEKKKSRLQSQPGIASSGAAVGEPRKRTSFVAAS